MYNLNSGHILGIISILVITTALGIYSGRRVKSEQNFSVGGKNASYLIVAGTLMGTLAGGAATIGTAQLAYLYGFSALWFTLGMSIGCMFLGVFFVNPLYITKKDTIPQMLEERFGQRARVVSSILGSIGIAIHIFAQILSAVALIASMFNINSFIAAVIAVLLMISYVVFGGVWGTGVVGILKTCLIYIVSIASGTLALIYGGGMSGFKSALTEQPYFSLFGRGVWIDAAAGLSIVIGVLSTQTYIQAVLSGKSPKESKKGALISSILVLPIGIAGVYVGIYMRINYPTIDPGLVFPTFIINNLNPLFAGVALATLLLTVVGTGAGLALGVGTILTKDIYKVYIRKSADNSELLKVTRLIIIATLSISLLFISSNMKSLILQWSFMSMGLRGATIFAPLCGALFIKRNIDSRMAICSMIGGPVFTFTGKFLLPVGVDPLYLGMTVSIAFITLGYLRRPTKIKHESAAI